MLTEAFLRARISLPLVGSNRDEGNVVYSVNYSEITQEISRAAEWAVSRSDHGWIGEKTTHDYSGYLIFDRFLRSKRVDRASDTTGDVLSISNRVARSKFDSTPSRKHDISSWPVTTLSSYEIRKKKRIIPC